MNQRLQGFVIGLVVTLVLGGTATAATKIGHLAAIHQDQSRRPAGSANAPKDDATDDAGSDGAKAGDGGSSSGDGSAGGHDAARGLQNAADHLSANLAAHPNVGLQNALTHVTANETKHASQSGSAKGGGSASGQGGSSGHENGGSHAPGHGRG